VTYEACVVDVEELLKGKLDGKKLTFTLRRVGSSPSAMPLLRSKEGVLLFLARSKDHGSESHLEGKWVPTTRGAIFDLTKPIPHAYSKDMKIVEEKKDLLKIGRAWARSPVKRSQRVEVPLGSPVFAKLFEGSSCYLIVPAGKVAPR